MAQSRLFIVAALAVLALSRPLPLISAPQQGTQAPAALSVRITSPLGRTGVSGIVRIVAQVTTAEKAPPPTVRILVDGTVLKTLTEPPYATEWADEDPLIPREIVVEASDEEGHTARDSVNLDPLIVMEESSVTAVVLEASVFNKDGRFIPGLAPDDFVLREDGVEQKIDLASQEKTPVTFALLIDSSQSMGYNIDFVRSAARRLGTYLRPIDRVIVAPFATALLPLTGPTDDRQTMLDAIGAFRNDGGTAILDSVTELAGRMNNVEGRRAIVLVTDGYDENSAATFDETLETLHHAQATVYVVGIGGIAGVSLKGEQLLRRLATETGGRAFFPWRAEDLVEIYDSLAVDVQERYLLAYMPSNRDSDGKWRAIEVSTRRGDAVAQTRQGYFAEMPPPIRPTVEFTLTGEEQRDYDVTVDDLVVFEDGIEQQIESFQEAVAPVSVVLALDASGSMRPAAQTVIEAAVGFVSSLRPNDALGVLTFADKSTLMQDLSVERAPSYTAIGQYVATGGTALYDALGDSFARLKKAEGRRAVVVVTDGRDEDNPGTGPGSTLKFDEVLQLQKESGAVVFGVGVGPNVDRAPLERLAEESGGEAYFPAEASALAEQYHQIVENLRRRFVISYTSTNEARDGAWRKVEIRVRSSNLLVSSSGGYFAPAK